MQESITEGLFSFSSSFYHLFIESAPWLLLGLFLAGQLKAFVSMQWMQRQLGGHGLKTTIKAAFLGAPLPLCSCGVIPAAMGLRRSGASRSATTAFMVATPETGVDSISVSYVLMGPFMAIIRPIAAIISAIVAGLLVGKSEQTTPTTPAPKSCCSGKSKPAVSDKQSVWEKSLFGIIYASTELIRDLSLWLLLGLGFAALVDAFVPTTFFTQWGSGIMMMLAMVLISIPMYICATASTPIAAGLLLAGVSPGAVLVFMLTGPATNIATLGVIKNELGARALWGYLGGVIGCALGFGFLTNIAIEQFDINVVPQLGEAHQLLPNELLIGSGLLLMSLMVWDVFRRYQTSATSA